MTFREVTDTSTALHRAMFFWKQDAARSFKTGCLRARAAGTSLQQCSSFPHDAAHRLGLRGDRHSSHPLSRWRASPNLLFLSAPVPNELCQCGGSCSAAGQSRRRGRGTWRSPAPGRGAAGRSSRARRAGGDMAEAAGRSGGRRRPAGEQLLRPPGRGGERATRIGSAGPAAAGGPALPGGCGRRAERERGGARAASSATGAGALRGPAVRGLGCLPRGQPQDQPGRRAEPRWWGRRARTVSAVAARALPTPHRAIGGPAPSFSVVAGRPESSARTAAGCPHGGGANAGAEPPGVRRGRVWRGRPPGCGLSPGLEVAPSSRSKGGGFPQGAANGTR